MWLWIVAGGMAYAGLMTLLFGILRSARDADRWDRAVFQTWLEEHDRPARRPHDRRSAA